MSKNRDCRIVKEIVEVIRVNENKNVKWKCEFKNKLIIFTYYLTLNYIIKLFYQIYLIYLMT